MDDATRKRIDDLVNSKRVFLFMKGTPSFPQCGFSGQVVAVLKHYGAEFDSCNVLDDQAIRQGIKEYANWPTIPQLYIGGEFVGGCDIVTELHHSDELGSMLKPAPAKS